MKRLRHDLDHLVSAALLVVAVAAILTGVIAHVWDLNDFRYHIWAGYAMTVLALAHVWLNWRQMVAYARFRLARKPRHQTPRTRQVRQREPVSAGQVASGVVLSRRGLFGLAVGGLGGAVLGRGLRPPPVLGPSSDVGLVYHEWSKPGVMDAIGTLTNWGEQPALYKRYPGAARVPLPAADLTGGLPTHEAIGQRRSTRDYADAPMTLEELSRVLLLTGGLNGERWGNRLRSAPSSGALYPIEMYPVVHHVDGLERGVYHYDVADHALELVRAGDLRDEVVRQALMQEFLGQSGVVLLFTVIFQRMRFKYRDRTYRYGLIEAGHLGQNAYLAATSMGLGACAVGAFLDDAINDMLGVDGREEAAVYMLSVGKTGDS